MDQQTFKEFFNSPRGACIVMLFIIFVLGIVATLMGVAYAEHITIGALVALLFRLGQ